MTAPPPSLQELHRTVARVGELENHIAKLVIALAAYREYNKLIEEWINGGCYVKEWPYIERLVAQCRIDATEKVLAEGLPSERVDTQSGRG